MKRSTNFYATLLILAVSMTGLGEIPNKTLVKKRMVADLEFIRNSFEVKYAPQLWKQEYSKWDLDAEFSRIKALILAHPQPTLKDYHIMLTEFFNSTKDYHVGIRFFSTEEALLPFMVKSTPSNRYFVVHVDSQGLSSQNRLEVGDEVLTFNGKPIHDVVTTLRMKEVGNNTPETDQALAERLLTHRRGECGQKVEQGQVTVGVKKLKGAKKETYTFNWSYYPEKIRDYSMTGGLAAVSAPVTSQVVDFKQEFISNPILNKLMVNPQFLNMAYKGLAYENLHEMGSRKSFVPPLGRKIWKSDPSNCFDAYIFQHPSGKNVGYIRIANYFGEEDEVFEFSETIKIFEQNTSCLVIDQLNNPGGSLFYLYGLASTLSPKPMIPPEHHIAITQEEVALAVTMLPVLEMVKDDKMAHELLGETLSGYPINLELVAKMRKFFEFIVSEWNQGNLYTSTSNVFGIDKIMPSKDGTYSKPILILTNSLDFSGGDFFPAILQDNKRATVLGTRTAGAGGFVLATNFPNHTGIKGFHLTGSLAKRLDLQPLENLGVTPDIYCPLTEKDLQENYVDYQRSILNAIDSLIKKG